MATKKVSEEMVFDRCWTKLWALASQIPILRGKHKPIYTPHVDTGDHVIVIALRDRLTGNKLQDKKYYHHSGYPGGLKVRTAADLLNSGRPERVLKLAVWGMLPHNRLGRKMFKKLKVYAGNEHPHSAQQPETLDI